MYILYSLSSICLLLVTSSVTWGQISSNRYLACPNNFCLLTIPTCPFRNIHINKYGKITRKLLYCKWSCRQKWIFSNLLRMRGNKKACSLTCHLFYSISSNWESEKYFYCLHKWLQFSSTLSLLILSDHKSLSLCATINIMK